MSLPNTPALPQWYQEAWGKKSLIPIALHLRVHYLSPMEWLASLASSQNNSLLETIIHEKCAELGAVFQKKINSKAPKQAEKTHWSIQTKLCGGNRGFKNSQVPYNKHLLLIHGTSPLQWPTALCHGNLALTSRFMGYAHQHIAEFMVDGGWENHRCPCIPLLMFQRAMQIIWSSRRST